MAELDLASILNISEQRAHQLLTEAGGEVETAVALHFSNLGQQQMGQTAQQAAQMNPQEQLRTIIGSHVSSQEATALLRRAGGHLETAVDLYFDEQAGPSRGGGEPSQPIADESESEEEAAANAPAGLRNRGRGNGSTRGGGRLAAQHTATAPRSRQLPAARQASAPAAARAAGQARPVAAPRQQAVPQPTPAPASTSPPSSSSDESSEAEEDDVSPAGNPRGALGLPVLFSNLLSRIIMGGRHTLADSDNGSEDEAAGAAKYPRSTGNPKVTQRLPSLQAAAAAKAHTQAPPCVLAAQLPLPKMRGVAGLLHSDNQDDVPILVTPNRATRFPVKLGTVLLPLHWVNPALKGNQFLQQWDSNTTQRGPGHTFHAQSWYTGYVTMEQAAYMTQGELEGTARLTLAGDNGTAVAMVWDNFSWVSEFLYSLYVLQKAGLLRWTLNLAHQGTAAGASEDAGYSNEAAAVGGASSKKAKAKAGAASGQQAAAQGQAAGAKKDPAAGKGKGKGKSGAAANEEEAGPSCAVAAAEPGAAGSAAAAPAAPTHAKLELQLTWECQSQLWWAEEHADLGEAAEEEKTKSKKTGSRHGAKFKRWRKHGAALGKVASALLQFGEGLRVGPDCDGLLNFGDTEAEAWDRLPSTCEGLAFRKLFDVRSLLDSVKQDHGTRPAMAPGGLLAHPKNYQLQGLQWMLDRERRGDAVERGQLHLHPAWLQLVTADMQLVYLHRLHPHVLSDNFYSSPVGGTCGGFLCDEMGLGKTLQSLMLVMSNPPPRGWAVSNLEGATVKEDGEGGEEAIPIRTTLVVVPSNLLGQWADEIQRHLHPGAITWCTYKPGAAAQLDDLGVDAATLQQGQRRSRRVQQLELQGKSVKPVVCLAPDGSALPMHEADLCLMSYEQLRDELHASKQHSSLLHQFGFWRIVLDEAQLVANSSSVAAVMASSLYRRHAWVCTGTPVTARLDEVKGLLEFLACEPFYHSHAWRGLVQGEYAEHSVAGLLSMRALLKGVMLRRTKADVAGELELPPCTREDRWVALSSVERLVYEQAKRGFVDAAFHVRQHHGAAARPGHGSRHGRTAGRALQALTALRQSCCHPQIVRRQDDVLGKERLSMRQIMDRLVTQAYSEWDNTTRNLVHHKALLAAVLCGECGHPGEALRPLLDLVRQNREAALSTDIRQQAMHRRLDGSMAPQDPPATAGPEEGEAGGSNASADGQPQQQQQQQQDGAAAGPNAAERAPRTGRKRHRDDEDAASQDLPGSSAAAAPLPPPHQQQQQWEGEGKELPQANGTSARGPGTAAEEEEGEKGEGEGMKGEELNEEERERAKEARARGRSWQKLELEVLELYRHMLQLCTELPKPSKARSSKRAKTDAGGSSSAIAAKQAPDREVVEVELQEAAVAVERLQAELGLHEGPGIVRRSKRQAGVDTEEEILMDDMDTEALQEQLLNAKVFIRAYNDAMKRRDPEKSAKAASAAAEKEAGEKWHHLQHLLNKEAALIAAEKGKGAVTDKQPEQAAGAAQQEDLNTCPICLDELSMRTITACGHHYCPSCIREVLAHGRRSCPICRSDIREEDLFDACSEEEARLKEQAPCSCTAGVNADYGSKVSALLDELAAMRSVDPGSKAVVFSSWGRLLKLVGDALQANGVEHASLCGANLQQRQEALQRFIHDPGCTVLLVMMSTSGGAAGLTLTVASTAFLMEPTLNPGLEAQACGRIYRLGQTKPTRVIRLLAEDSVEARVLEIQKRKLESGEGPAETALQEVDAGIIMQLYDELK